MGLQVSGSHGTVYVLARLFHEPIRVREVSASATGDSVAEVSAQRLRALLKTALRRAERLILSKPRAIAARRSPEGDHFTILVKWSG